jgi:hypothetical protein
MSGLLLRVPGQGDCEAARYLQRICNIRFEVVGGRNHVNQKMKDVEETSVDYFGR